MFHFVDFTVCLTHTETLDVLSKSAAVNFSNHLINLIAYFLYHYQMEILLAALETFQRRNRGGLSQ